MDKRRRNDSGDEGWQRECREDTVRYSGIEDAADDREQRERRSDARGQSERDAGRVVRQHLECVAYSTLPDRAPADRRRNRSPQ